MAREYKDSGIEWIGQIPKEWEVCQIRRVMKNRSERNLPNAEVLSLYRDWGIVPKNSRDDNHNVTSEDTTNYKVVHKGDFVINKMKAWQGSMAVSDYDGIISPAYYVCEFVRTSVYKRYIHHLLRNESYKTEYMRLSSGLRVGQWDLNIENFLRIPMILPSFSEQQKIADYLDKVCGEIDEMVALQETMIEELKAYKQSVITEAVTKGLNPNVPMRNSGIDWIGEIPEHWDLARVGLFYFVTKLAGFEYTDTLMNKISSSDDVPIVRAQNVKMYRFEKESISEFIDLETSLLLDRCSLNKKSLLMTFIGAGIGDVCIFNESNRYHLAPNVAKIEKNSDFDNIIYDEYIMYYLGSDAGKGEINKISKASAQASLSMSTIRKIAIAVPPLDEQRVIASYLDTKCSEIDSLIALKQAKIEELKEYKKSVIYEYVTGKKEVV